MKNNCKSKSLLRITDGEELSPNDKKFNLKGKQLSFSQASEISDDTKENYKLFSPVSKTKIIFFQYYNLIIIIL
jgi:hypothetical protein